MQWFLMALSSVFLWSFVTYLDKFIIERFIKGRSVGSLILFSSLFAGVVIPVIALINKDVFSISRADSGLLALSGVLGSLAVIFYLYALEDEETSLVVPLFQMIPVISYVLGYIFLDEALAGRQIIAGLIILAGAVVLTLEIEEEKKIRLKLKPLLLMGASSLMFSVMDILYKFVSVGEEFWPTQFWHYVGLFIFGILLFLGVREYRQEFYTIVRRAPLPIFFANVGGEFLQVAANILNSSALLLAPVVLVTLVNAYTPVVVFLLGILFTFVMPRFITEKVTRKHLIHKSFAIGLVIGGSILLYS